MGVLLAVLVGSMQPNMARRAQDHPGSDPGVFPFGPFYGRLGAEAHLAKLDSRAQTTPYKLP